jgi:hypothetical protein
MASLLCVAAVSPLSAASLEEAIAKHIEARGGRENWEKIRSLRLTGDYTAFSKVEPFTLTRARDNSYVLDTKMNDRVVIIGYDGETTWWDNHWFKEGAQRTTGIDAEVARGDAHFVNPLFNFEALGMKAEFLGDTEYEGMPAVGIKLTRSDESEEVWYLDPDTYLEYARTSPGSDFGQPRTQRTFFDDFREVEGVMIPFHVETQWYTRDRVMSVEKAEVNIDVDLSYFSMPAPEGMADLLHMAGEWKVAVAQRNQPGAPLEESEREVTIESAMDGRLLSSSYSTADGEDVTWTLSYDTFRKTYRLTEMSGASGYMDVEEGAFDDAGKLTLSNVVTELPYLVADMTVFSRFSVSGLSPDGFKIEREASIDGGESWFVAAEEVYTPKP